MHYHASCVTLTPSTSILCFFNRFFGAHLRTELYADGNESLVGFNASEEPTSALLNFFEYDSGFRLLYKATHRLQVQSMAQKVCCWCAWSLTTYTHTLACRGAMLNSAMTQAESCPCAAGQA